MEYSVLYITDEEGGCASSKTSSGLLLVLVAVVLLAAVAYDSTADLKKYATGFTIPKLLPDFISTQYQANNNNSNTFASIIVNTSTDRDELTSGTKANKDPKPGTNGTHALLTISSTDSSQQAETQPQNETALPLENQVTTTPLTSIDEARDMTIIHQASLQYATHLQA
jgi:hypothetical protein